MSAVIIGMFSAYTMLNVLTSIVAASSIFGMRFVTKISSPKELLANDDHSKVFSIDNSEHYRIVKLLGEWTHTTRSIIWFPIILLLVLTVARIFVFENFGHGEVIRLCYVVVITLLIFVPVWKLRARARNLRHDLIDDLKNKLVNSYASDSPNRDGEQISPRSIITPEQIKIIIEEIEKYQKGIYSNHFWYPAVPVLLVLSGGMSSPLLLEFLFQ